jgi:hypothetical protein
MSVCSLEVPMKKIVIIVSTCVAACSSAVEGPIPEASHDPPPSTSEPRTPDPAPAKDVPESQSEFVVAPFSSWNDCTMTRFESVDPTHARDKITGLVWTTRTAMGAPATFAPVTACTDQGAGTRPATLAELLDLAFAAHLETGNIWCSLPPLFAAVDIHEPMTTAEGACLTLNMGGWVSDPAWGAPCARTTDVVLATLCVR